MLPAGHWMKLYMMLCNAGFCLKHFFQWSLPIYLAPLCCCPWVGFRPALDGMRNVFQISGVDVLNFLRRFAFISSLREWGTHGLPPEISSVPETGNKFLPTENTNFAIFFALYDFLNVAKSRPILSLLKFW